MKPFVANLINSIALIGMGTWGYFAATTQSVTILIPVFFGVALLLCTPGVKSENKIVAHIAVLLTALILLALFMPLKGVIERENMLGILRVGTMLSTTILSMVVFVKSFIDNKKARSA